MFRKKKRNREDLGGAIKQIPVQAVESEYRPCYVNGRKALFHRWVNTANPALPRGADPNDERAKFFQHRSTTGLVEYADGTLTRAWPQDIRFADGGRFKEFEWLPIEQLEELECKKTNG